jgi:hypothetical protein
VPFFLLQAEAVHGVDKDGTDIIPVPIPDNLDIRVQTTFDEKKGLFQFWCAQKQYTRPDDKTLFLPRKDAFVKYFAASDVGLDDDKISLDEKILYERIKDLPSRESKHEQVIAEYPSAEDITLKVISITLSRDDQIKGFGFFNDSTRDQGNKKFNLYLMVPFLTSGLSFFYPQYDLKANATGSTDKKVRQTRPEGMDHNKAYYVLSEHMAKELLGSAVNQQNIVSLMEKHLQTLYADKNLNKMILRQQAFTNKGIVFNAQTLMANIPTFQEVHKIFNIKVHIQYQ